MSKQDVTHWAYGSSAPARARIAAASRLFCGKRIGLKYFGAAEFSELEAALRQVPDHVRKRVRLVRMVLFTREEKGYIRVRAAPHDEAVNLLKTA